MVIQPYLKLCSTNLSLTVSRSYTSISVSDSFMVTIPLVTAKLALYLKTAVCSAVLLVVINGYNDNEKNDCPSG